MAKYFKPQARKVVEAAGAYVYKLETGGSNTKSLDAEKKALKALVEETIPLATEERWKQKLHELASLL